MWKIDLLYRISQPEECKLIYSSLRGMLKDFSMGKNLENADILMNENSKLIAKGCVTVF
jgi:hypothetical protein